MSRVFCSAETESSTGNNGERSWIVAHRGAGTPELAPGVALCEEDAAVRSSIWSKLRRRRQHAELVARRVAERLVDRLPPEDEVAERLRAEGDVARPVIGAGVVVAERTVADLGEPPREGEVVQTDPGCDPGVTRGGEHRAVVLDRGRRPAGPLRARCGPTRSTGDGGEAVFGVEGEVVGVARAEPVAVAAARIRAALLPGIPVGRRRRALGTGSTTRRCPTRSRRGSPPSDAVTLEPPARLRGASVDVVDRGLDRRVVDDGAITGGELPVRLPHEQRVGLGVGRRGLAIACVIVT